MANRLQTTDLDLNFSANPLSGDISKITNSEAIKRSLRNLVFLNSYEKPFHPEIAGNIRNLLFESEGPFIEVDIKERMQTLINRYEPRVRLREVKVASKPNENSIDISIYFSVGSSSIIDQITTSIERIR